MPAARHVMYALLFGFQNTNMFVWRGLTAQVMSFILAEYSQWPPARVAFLLGSFSLGYVPLQIPYSLLARRTGQKLLCTINLLAQAAGCALLPAAAGRGPGCLSAVLAVLGVFQGSRVPCVQVLQRRWVPDGLERVRFQQVTMWAGQAATLCHFSAIPLLAQWFGWRVLPRWYALQSLTMAALWHAFAADSPAEWQGPVPMTAEEFQLLHQIGRDGEVAAPANSGQQPQLEHSGVVMQDEPPPQEGLEGCSQSAPQQHPLSSEQSAVRAAVGSVGRNTQPTLSMEAASEQQMRRQHWQPGGDATEAAVLLVDKNLPPLSLRQLFTIRQMQGMLAMCLVECSFPTFTKVQALWTLYFSERYSLPMEHVRKTQAVSEAETPHAAFGACFIQSEFCALHTIGWQVLLRQTALMAPMAVVASLLEGVVETTLIRRGWETIDIRRGSSTAGYLLQILLKLGDIFAPTANLAFAVQFCNVFVGPLHQAGFNLSGREMGGEESGVYSAVTNCINRADGLIGPIVATAIKNVTGSWIPVYHVAIVGLVIKLVLYWRSVSIKPARVLFAEQTGLSSW